MPDLIATTKAGTEPLRRYHRLRKRVLGLETYHNYDTAIPLVDFDRKYPYEDVQAWLPVHQIYQGHCGGATVPEVLAWYGIQDGDNGEYRGSPDARSWAQWHDNAPKQGA